jgi:hypothetical protein
LHRLHGWRFRSGRPREDTGKYSSREAGRSRQPLARKASGYVAKMRSLATLSRNRPQRPFARPLIYKVRFITSTDCI